MTGEDHDTDALIAALTSPALPSEQVGEEAVVTAMLDALPGVPAGPAERRSRRSITIAAVTIASLGVGGLVAAGPGAFFSPAADRAPAPEPSTTERDPTARPPIVDATPGGGPTGPNRTATSSTLPIDAAQSPTDTGREGLDEEVDDCDATHGDVVSDVARSSVPGQQVPDVARSDCGKPDTADHGTPSDTAPGRTGETPADTAPGRTGETPADTAPGRTGETPADTAPAQNGAVGNVGASDNQRP